MLSEGMKTRLMNSSDLFQRLTPRSCPSREKMERCRIISHRGAHDNVQVFENTLPAFERAAAAGIWGIELDVNWTGDLHPVVLHDPDLQRVFHRKGYVRHMDLSELRAWCPQVPTLAEVLESFGKRVHLMIEIKAAAFNDPLRQNEILEHCLAGLRPQTDYHLLSLDPNLFDRLPWVASRSWVAVAELNLAAMSRIALKRDLQGIAGHYALASNGHLQRHHRVQQHVGTAYPGSKNCLFREINRGVDWIFSNRALRMQSLIDGLLRA